MPISQGLKTSLNQIRETSIQNNTLYAKYVDEIYDTTDIGTFASPILEMPNLANEFMNMLVQRIVYTQVNVKLFNNPLRRLEGDRIPLGSIGQEIHINPAKGRKFNVNDFAGLLAKYDADVKIQYMHLNSDLQYCVTITRAKLKDAFVTWGTLEDFIGGLTQSLYNGAYIDQFNLTKGLVSSAYTQNAVHVEVVDVPTTEEEAKAFITKARTVFLNMQTPSSSYNAWRQVGGYGRDILTWSNPEDIVFLLRNDLASYIDVNVLAQSFNIDRSTLLGNIIYVDNFNQYDNDGNLIFDGSKILGIMADRSWFRIKEQETTMDEFYNANNRSWQYYLNIVKMYQFSLFSNAIVWATEQPQVQITAIESIQNVVMSSNEVKQVPINTNPKAGNTPEIKIAPMNPSAATITYDSIRKIMTITASKTDATRTSNVTVSSGSNTQTFSLTINPSSDTAVTIPEEGDDPYATPAIKPENTTKNRGK